VENEKLQDRARDELFSHINRCGVLQATGDDQEHWMEETIEYIGERYPDLSDSDLKVLREVGIRFCQPAIPHGGSGGPEDDAKAEAQPEAEVQAERAVSEESAAEEDESEGLTSVKGESEDLVANGAGAENTAV
jgi:hypothetical protein